MNLIMLFYLYPHLARVFCFQITLLIWYIPLFVMGGIFLVIGGVVGIFVIIVIYKSKLGQSYLIQYNPLFLDHGCSKCLSMIGQQQVF